MLAGISVEFGVVKQRIEGGDHRIVEEAMLSPLGGMAIVNVPAYPDSVVSMKRWAKPEPKPVTIRYFRPVV